MFLFIDWLFSGSEILDSTKDTGWLDGAGSPAKFFTCPGQYKEQYLLMDSNTFSMKKQYTALKTHGQLKFSFQILADSTMSGNNIIVKLDNVQVYSLPVKRTFNLFDNYNANYKFCDFRKYNSRNIRFLGMFISKLKLYLLTIRQQQLIS